MENIFDLYAAVLIGLEGRTGAKRSGPGMEGWRRLTDEEIWLLASLRLHRKKD